MRFYGACQSCCCHRNLKTALSARMPKWSFCSPNSSHKIQAGTEKWITELLPLRLLETVGSIDSSVQTETLAPGKRPKLIVSHSYQMFSKIWSNIRKKSHFPRAFLTDSNCLFFVAISQNILVYSYTCFQSIKTFSIQQMHKQSPCIGTYSILHSEKNKWNITKWSGPLINDMKWFIK